MPPSPAVDVPDQVSRTVHGHERAYVDVGQGPAVVLLHGIGSDSRTWHPVIPGLVARGYRVIAPDFLGHGASAKPRADYSLGGFANGLRDLLTILDIDAATIVGHSFGGGVAMQFAYQYPERTDRVMLVGSGGLGRDVHPLLRGLTLPGASFALAVAVTTPFRQSGGLALRVLHKVGVPGAVDLAELATVYTTLTGSEARRAFLHVLRAAVDWRGQVVTMVDRSYLAAGMPICVVWGTRDSVIPATHAAVARDVLPGARIELFERAGHFPHRHDPTRFVDVLDEFVRQTAPSEHHRAEWRNLLIAGAD
jgi:pimeloyl-ACP methyl ester carboxylesterase